MLWASFKKEIKESIRKHRFLVLIGLLLLIAIASPTLAKLMPKLLGSMESNSDAEGIKIIFSREPNVLDGFFQYIKNLNLYPIFVILIFMGLISDERTNGTAEMILTKPISRSCFLLSKFLAATLLILMGIIISTGVCLFYSYVLFGSFKIANFILINLYLFFYLVAFVAFIIFMGVISKSTGMVAIGGIGFYVLLLVTGSIPVLRSFNPQTLYNATSLIIINKPAPYLLPSLVSTILLIASFLVAACLIFEKKEI